MIEVPKVFVVDDGERSPDGALSAELAGLGYASVTASLEAAEDVLGVLQLPAAVLIQMPKPTESFRRRKFVALAERLKESLSGYGVPIIMVESSFSVSSGSFAAVLQSYSGSAIAARPMH